MVSPPKGRYSSAKRTRSSESSANDSDDLFTQDNPKKHRMGSPKTAQTPQNTPTAQLETQGDITEHEEDQAQQNAHEDQPRAVTTKKNYLAEGWEFFDAYKKK